MRQGLQTVHRGHGHDREGHGGIKGDSFVQDAPNSIERIFDASSIERRRYCSAASIGGNEVHRDQV